MQELRHIEALLESRKESLKVAQERYKTGEAKYLDVVQASAGCAESDAKLAKANADYETCRAKFAEISGYVLPLTLNAPEKMFDTEMAIKQAIDLAMRNNPNIIASANALAAAREAAKKTLGKLFPTIDVSYSFNQSKSNPAQTDGHHSNSRGHVVGLTAKIPIYDGGVGRSENRQAQEFVSKAAVENAKVIEETKTEIISTWAALSAAQRNLASVRAAVSARELALKVTEEEYQAGFKIVNDVLKAQQELFEAKYLEIQAEKEYFVSQCTAIALIGRMNPRYLKLEVAPGPGFSYEDHFKGVKSRL
jgi:outer membrane protein TolC